MLADMSKLSPIKEATTSSGVLRRRQDKARSQKVLPRERSSGAANEDKAGRERGRGLNAYA